MEETMLTMLQATTAEMTTLRMSFAIEATEGETSRVCRITNSPGKACLTAMSEVKSPIGMAELLWRQLSWLEDSLQRRVTIDTGSSSGPCAACGQQTRLSLQGRRQSSIVQKDLYLGSVGFH